VLMYNEPQTGVFRYDASPSLLHALAKVLMSLPSSFSTASTNYSKLAKSAYKEAEKRALSSRGLSFYGALEKYHPDANGGRKHKLHVHLDGKLWLLQNMISPFDANQIIHLSKTIGMNTSAVALAEVAGHEKIRTSESAYVPKEMLRENVVFQSLIHTLSQVVNVPFNNAASSALDSLEIQIVHYSGPQSFALHHDAGPLFPRLFSLFIYLNTVAQGGETCFPSLSHRAVTGTRSGGCGQGKNNGGTGGLCIHPEGGTGLLFYNLNVPDGTIDSTLKHEACPLEEVGAEKWGMNVWFSI
jgi:hypothetical protein